MTFPLRKAGDMAEQAEHLVLVALGIDQGLAQHHVATALTIDHSAATRRCPYAVQKRRRPRDRAGMKFRITARQKHRIAVDRWCPINQR